MLVVGRHAVARLAGAGAPDCGLYSECRRRHNRYAGCWPLVLVVTVEF